MSKKKYKRSIQTEEMNSRGRGIMINFEGTKVVTVIPPAATTKNNEDARLKHPGQ